jgi:hypothetical protein
MLHTGVLQAGRTEAPTILAYFTVFAMLATPTMAVALFYLMKPESRWRPSDRDYPGTSRLIFGG